MADSHYLRLQFTVFALVAASFTNIYITQPLLPVLQAEFATSMSTISASVSAVIFDITITNLPFGALSDKIPIQPIILSGGVMVALFKKMFASVFPPLSTLLQLRCFFVSGIEKDLCSASGPADIKGDRPRETLKKRGLIYASQSSNLRAGIRQNSLALWVTNVAS